MKIAITWDYELFFGDRSGAADKCMIEPTQRLISLAEKHNVPFTFFPDAGCLLKFEEFNLDNQLSEIQKQIRSWDNLGHETGLHIHPHWEKSSWNGQEWEHDLSYYKLSDFNKENAAQIVRSYTTCINRLLRKPMASFRAGGWCVQPFEHFSEALFAEGITVDTSVFKGGQNQTPPYQYDFSEVPDAHFWRFSTSPTKEDESGAFREFPIASTVYSPWFFWKLFVLGRLFPSRHKPIGNGIPAKGGGSKRDLLTRSHRLCVSADGYFASKLGSIVKKLEGNNEPILVVIGHPKALTEFSFETLDRFIGKHKGAHKFVTISQLP